MTAKINSAELRIGNFIKDYGQIIKVAPSTIVTLYQIELAINGGIETSINYEPIPLTNEILEGIEGCKNWNWHKEYYIEISDDIYIIINHKSETAYLRISPEEYEDGETLKKNIPECKYVHQLQNLYFALTNTKLPITLK